MKIERDHVVATSAPKHNNPHIFSLGHFPTSNDFPRARTTLPRPAFAHDVGLDSLANVNSYPVHDMDLSHTTEAYPLPRRTLRSFTAVACRSRPCTIPGVVFERCSTIASDVEESPFVWCSAASDGPTGEDPARGGGAVTFRVDGMEWKVTKVVFVF